ncbi:MAG: hypothetical protein A2Z96_07010 [Spirochaetes bacterium GWB1_48_6]|nr:MAG: hypothetical protein A2Z96_07010 [Spirochaetes bacterium GWB1_48_6]
MNIDAAVKARDEAQTALEKSVKESFPLGTKVIIKGLRGDEEKTVDGHDGESLVIGKQKRHFSKVRKG